MSTELNYTVADLMIITMARLLKDAENAFMGVASNLPFFAIWLAKELYNPDLVWLSIPGKVNPRPEFAPKSTVHGEMTHGGSASITLAEIFDMSARGELDVAFLSGVQIDSFGNFNLSHIPEGDKIKVQFTGGAGSALICANAKRVILWRTKHDRRTFDEKCSIITASGNVYRVVTTDVVFRKDNSHLALDSIHPFTTFDEVAGKTGFDVSPAPFTPEPTEDELKLLNDFDKDNVRQIEFGG